MKQLFTFILILVSINNYGQTAPKVDLTNDKELKNVAQRLNLEPGSDHKISVIFTVDESGNITNVKARAEYPELEEEAKRIVSELPKMDPAIRNGEAISQNYALPIIFQVESLREEKTRLRKEKRMKNIQDN